MRDASPKRRGKRIYFGLEYGEIVEKMKKLDGKFKIRG
jgi:hypothetical protein